MEERMPSVGTLEQTATYGKFVVEPLDRGYGNTLGNSLRRVLLSSIPGSAVTAIKIDKVLHEFSKIDGVKEDATELLLNLKALAVKVHTSGPASEDEHVLQVHVNGTGRVTGADIQCPADLEVVNPEVYLATVSDPDATFAMELFVGQGKGYAAPDKQDPRHQAIGIIPIGAQFTPVRSVNYVVEATRLGHKTDFERLILEVTTNGTITPSEAVSQAAVILDRYVRLFMDLAQFRPDALPVDDDPSMDPMLASVPDTRIEELDFSQRTFNCLRRASLLTLRDLVQVSESDLINIRGFGRKSLQEVKEKLDSLGLGVHPAKTTGAVKVVAGDFDDEEYEDENA